MLMEFFEHLREGNVADPPYEYEFLVRLNESEYPKYLRRIFNKATGDNLNLKFPKTFNEKIQWLKLYDTTPQKTIMSDKLLVRDEVKKIIGEEYLKPVLWVGKDFDSIPFNDLPSSFIIKTNHGCKWYYLIKKKDEFLRNPALIKMAKSYFDGWMKQSYSFFTGFEMQYKNIVPQIFIEPLLRENIDKKPNGIEIYCFNGVPKIYQKIKYNQPREVSVYDENYNNINLKFLPEYILINEPADEQIKQAVSLSEKLAKGYKFARIDWLIYQNKLYFNEINFTPFSGFYHFEDKKWNIQLGKMLNLRKN